MPKRTTDYRSLLLEDLRDPEEAASYLTAALHDSKEMFLVALRDVAEAHQMSKVAGKVGVSRESLYRMLATSGNPTYRNFFGILRALDVTFGDVRARSSIPDRPLPGSKGRRSQRTHHRGSTPLIGAAIPPIERGNSGSPTGEQTLIKEINPSLPHPQRGSEPEIGSTIVVEGNNNPSHVACKRTLPQPSAAAA
jgi:probable addiction module antidote protein